MENNVPGSMPSLKDKKNGRFFRKSGTSSASTTPVTGHPRTQHQRSFDSCSPLYNPPLQVIGQQNIDPALLASFANGLNRHQQQQQHQKQMKHQNISVSGTTNSSASSILQSPVIFNEHDTIKANGQRFMAAPRRARSAERFDGMRVVYSVPGDLSVHSRQSPAGTPTATPPIAAAIAEEHALYRNYRSPQILRAGMIENGIGSPPTLPLQPQLRQSAVASPVPSLASTSTGPIPSPPPPYSKAINEIPMNPPSYNQAVAAMNKISAGKKSKILVNGKHRFNHANRGTQSFDMGTYMATSSAASTSSGSGTPGSNGLRAVSSNPAFMNDSSNDLICSCPKCQALYRDPGCNDLNDAVYMESQAFLLHEIMNDGMAFCCLM